MSNVDDALAAARKHLRESLLYEMETAAVVNWNFVEAAAAVARDRLIRKLSPPECDEAGIKELIDDVAAGSESADNQLRFVAIQFLARGLPLPAILYGFVSDALKAGIRQPKRHRWQNSGRDLQIGITVYLMQAQFGFRPTRNYAARDLPDATESGCSLVAKALADMGVHVSEDAVEKIWKKRPDL